MGSILTCTTFFFILILARCSNIHQEPRVNATAKDPGIDSVFRSPDDIQYGGNGEGTAMAPLQAVQNAFQSFVDPIKHSLYDEQMPQVQEFVVHYSVKLEVKADLDRVFAAWNQSPASITCALMRALTAGLSRVLQALQGYFHGTPSPSWSQHRSAITHWLDEFVCATPPDLGPSTAIFFFLLVTLSLVLRPRWVMLGSLLYALSAMALVSALAGSITAEASNGVVLALVAAVHVGSAAGLLLTLVAVLGAGLCVFVATLNVAVSTAMVLLLGTPSFWFFVFSPVFFITRLTMFNPFTALPGVLFLLFSGLKYAQGILKAFVIRSLQPFVRSGVFVYMLGTAAWAGGPSDVFPQFKWMWRFHAAVWVNGFWAPAWVLGSALYGLQLAWALLILDLIAQGSGRSLSADLTGAQFVFFSLKTGLRVSLSLGLLKLGYKGVRLVLEWREKKRKEQEEKLKAVEELGYVPLNAKDLAKNPQLLQQQFQQRVAAQDKMRKRR